MPVPHEDTRNPKARQASARMLSAVTSMEDRRGAILPAAASALVEVPEAMAAEAGTGDRNVDLRVKCEVSKRRVPMRRMKMNIDKFLCPSLFGSAAMLLFLMEGLSTPSL